MPPKSTKGGKRGRPKKEKKEEAGEESKAPVEKKKKIDEKVEDEEKAKWWEEPICANLNLRAKMQGDYKEFKSKFQDVKILDTLAFGRQLILDGYSQSSRSDEHVYHESLVHPAMFLHPNPKTVFIGGGGEMATAREVLKHKSVEKLVMVDIDGEVVDLCKKMLTEWDIAWVDEDPRFELVIDDAKKYLEEYKGKFDVVIMDIADPIQAGPGIALYYQDFYKALKDKLNPGFTFVTQSGPCGILTHKECFTTIHSTMRASFDNVVPFNAFMACFCDTWGFNIGYDTHASLPSVAEFKSREVAVTDKLIQERIKPGQKLKFYDGIGHRGQMHPPRYIREAVEAEKRVMTAAQPVFMDSSYKPVGIKDA
jgi:spermidine synthase